MKIPEGSALLIIDVQKDFCPGGSLEVRGGEDIIPVINALSPRFAAVAATRDWHPEGHVSFASAHPNAEPFSTADYDYHGSRITQSVWPDHCIAGSDGADFHQNLNIEPIDCILHKGTSPGLDSYSAFYENDRKTPTGLAGYLHSLSVRTLYLTGLAEDVCVYYSALDGVKEGFNVLLVTDATKGIDYPPGSLEERREHMVSAGIFFTESRNLLVE